MLVSTYDILRLGRLPRERLGGIPLQPILKDCRGELGDAPEALLALLVVIEVYVLCISRGGGAKNNLVLIELLPGVIKLIDDVRLIRAARHEDIDAIPIRALGLGEF